MCSASHKRARSALLAGLCAMALAGCDREVRSYRSDPVPDEVAVSDQDKPQPAIDYGFKAREFENNAFQVAQGKQLFVWFNCSGCHGGGGGGNMGPPLTDAKWLYGSDIGDIVETIKKGRPNGMPAFEGKVPDDVIWQLAAYVRSMGVFLRKDVAPGRSDTMFPRPSEGSVTPFFNEPRLDGASK